MSDKSLSLPFSLLPILLRETSDGEIHSPESKRQGERGREGENLFTVSIILLLVPPVLLFPFLFLLSFSVSIISENICVSGENIFPSSHILECFFFILHSNPFFILYNLSPSLLLVFLDDNFEDGGF